MGSVCIAVFCSDVATLDPSVLFLLRSRGELAAPGEDMLVAARFDIPADTDQRLEPELQALFPENLAPEIARGD